MATYKRLTRSSKNKVLGGVAGGLGTYFNIDPTIIRLVLLLLTVMHGSGLLLYIILWVILPLDKNVSKDETISGEMVRDNINEMKGAVTNVAREVKKSVHQEKEKEEKEN